MKKHIKLIRRLLFFPIGFGAVWIAEGYYDKKGFVNGFKRTWVTGIEFIFD